ncbi:hypothetical protein AAG570_012530 [Ranatra chinensis]|uniref:Nonsense-mediated mRNA decay factor SMG8 n=1 Tax=Ranatra chinensis TaxID=642074 RepID=A0ABD0YE40_9HEMI
MSKFILQLKEECDRFWKSGRQMCEILSLTGNPCTKPMHVVTNTQSSQLRSVLPIYNCLLDHWSGVCYMSSCNCGVRQGTRPDPFTIRAANFEFYLTTGEECGCVLLERINFPIFQPSIHNFRYSF